jgi:hypothetical protein
LSLSAVNIASATATATTPSSWFPSPAQDSQKPSKKIRDTRMDKVKEAEKVRDKEKRREERRREEQWKEVKQQEQELRYYEEKRRAKEERRKQADIAQEEERRKQEDRHREEERRREDARQKDRQERYKAEQAEKLAREQPKGHDAKGDVRGMLHPQALGVRESRHGRVKDSDESDNSLRKPVTTRNKHRKEVSHGDLLLHSRMPDLSARTFSRSPNLITGSLL